MRQKHVYPFLINAHYTWIVMAEREQPLSLTPSQLAKAKDAIELLSSLTSTSTSQNSGARGGEFNRSLSGPSDAGTSRSSFGSGPSDAGTSRSDADLSRKRTDQGEALFILFVYVGILIKSMSSCFLHYF